MVYEGFFSGSFGEAAFDDFNTLPEATKPRGSHPYKVGKYFEDLSKFENKNTGAQKNVKKTGDLPCTSLPMLQVTMPRGSFPYKVVFGKSEDFSKSQNDSARKNVINTSNLVSSNQLPRTLEEGAIHQIFPSTSLPMLNTTARGSHPYKIDVVTEDEVYDPHRAFLLREQQLNTSG